MIPDSEIVAYGPARRFESVEVGHYPGGEPLITYVPSLIDALIVRPSSMETLMAALFFIDVSKDRGYPPFDLVLPYFPGARQDRTNNEGDMLFTARSVAKMINHLDNLAAVKVLDPHSDVVPALLNKCRVYSAAFALGGEISFLSTTPDYVGVIAPDGGSVKRVDKVAQLMEVPVYQGRKHRDVRTGQLTGFSIEPLPPGHYLVVDDICDGGGTFIGLSQKFVAGVTADLYVTHGIFSKGTDELLARYDRIFCSDSLIVNAPGVEVIRTVERMV
jgi:ribose-phosphate pyrophosphokinase